MKEARIIMGMPVMVEIKDTSASEKFISRVFDYFHYIDEKFSTYKNTSEIERINSGLLEKKDWSIDMKTIFELSEKTKKDTNGYFDIVNNEGKYDPSGMVKGWAIYNAAELLKNAGFKHFYIEAGGDIQVFGESSKGNGWKVGIRNPFNPKEIIKVVYLKNNEGIATSGTYERGAHIYNPKNRQKEISQIVSLTVIGPNIYEADRFATAAFAMQKEGIHFIENLPGFEAYMVDENKVATMTTNFDKYTINN